MTRTWSATAMEIYPHECTVPFTPALPCRPSSHLSSGPTKASIPPNFSWHDKRQIPTTFTEEDDEEDRFANLRIAISGSSTASPRPLSSFSTPLFGSQSSSAAKNVPPRRHSTIAVAPMETILEEEE